LIAVFAGVGGPIIVRALRVAHARRDAPLRGSIGRAVTWTGSSGTVSLLSGPSKGAVVSAWCETETSVGEHVVLAEESPRGWLVIHLDDA
jgi:hypothetical protein